MKALDLTGQKFGMLVVQCLADATPSNHRRWLCVCECGRVSKPTTGSLRSGKATSCGCGVGLSARQRFTTHGLSQGTEYRIWCNMLSRTRDSANPSYQNYGGRGITVCDRWASSFEAFYADMGQRPSRRHTLDRIDNDGGYEASNCRWATYEVQAANRRSTKLISYHGKTLTLGEWSALTGLSAGTINARLRRGWATDRALQAEARKARQQ